MNTLIHGDCFVEMPKLPEKTFNLILADPPYGTTELKWDAVFDLKAMWQELNRLACNNAAIVLCCSEPFTSVLINSNFDCFKYRWTWDKVRPSGFIYARYRPLQQVEDLAVFSVNGNKPEYYPQMTKRATIEKKHYVNKTSALPRLGDHRKTGPLFYDTKHPTTLLRYSRVDRAQHPTQKPVELMEYLIKTYTNEKNSVLDFCMGSGTTGVACKRLNRQFVGIEKNKAYFEIAKRRIKHGKEGVSAREAKTQITLT